MSVETKTIFTNRSDRIRNGDRQRGDHSHVEGKRFDERNGRGEDHELRNDI